MKYKTVKNTSKRAIIIDTPKGETVSIPAGTTLNDIELDPVQVSNLEEIEMLEAVTAEIVETAEKTKTKTKVETIELPAEFTAVSLASTFNDEQLKAYCKSNKITGITGKKGADLAELIVEDYAAKLNEVPGQKEES